MNSVPAAILERFERPSDDGLRRLLEPPRGPVRLIIDTDAANEIDDQFALTWALLSPDRIEMEGVTAEPFSFQHLRPGLLRSHAIVEAGGPSSPEEAQFVAQYSSWLAGLASVGKRPEDVVFVPPDQGMELSYREILTVYEKLGLPSEGRVFRGAPGYLQSFDEPIHSPAVEHIIARALEPEERPLYVAAIGCVSNIASALLLAPEIIRNLVVVWTSAYPSCSPHDNADSLNLVQDKLASQLLFDCGVAHVYLPGFHVGAQLRLSLPDMETWIKGRGAIGDYLHHLYTHNPIHEQRGVADIAWRSWIIWDMINIAWLIDPDWVPSRICPSPILGDDFLWRHRDGRHPMREAHDVNRDAIFHDLYRKLDRLSG